MAVGRQGPEALEKGALPKLLCNFCIPSLAGSLVTSVYNMVDQVFIGKAFGVVGNAATNVVFPAVTLITALSLMCGVGTSAVMNLALGKGKEERAVKSVASGIVLMILCGGVMTIAILGWTEHLLRIFGCTDMIMPYAEPYARITAIGFIFAMIGASGPFIVRADGSPGYALICTAVGSGLNVLLDWIFIFKLGSGMAGAAWATVIAQGVSAAMIIVYFTRLKTVTLKAEHFKVDFKIKGSIMALGTGPMFNFLTQALVQIFLNIALRKYGADSIYGSEAALAAAGVANKVNTLAVAVVTGLTNGMQPIISYNYGKKNYDRVNKVSRVVIGMIVAVSFLIFLCYQLIPREITGFFGDGSPEYFEFAARFFRIFFMLIFLNGLQSSVGGFFSAQGKPGYSILISLTRQVIFLPPLLVILPLYFGLSGVLWSGPAADFAMACVALFLMFREQRRLKVLASSSSTIVGDKVL